jgi:integrase
MPKPKEMVKKRWRAQRGGWEVVYPEGGKLRKKFFRTEAEAVEFQVEILDEVQKNTPRPMDAEILLRDFLLAWKQVEATRTDPRTYEDRVDQLERHVLPVLGHVQVQQLRAAHVLTLLARLQDRGLSRNAIRLAKDALSIVCGLAVVRGMLKMNPCHNMGVYAKFGGTAPKEPNPMTEVQLAAFDAAMAERHGRTFPMLFRLMADTGLRPGEVRGLKMEDLDWPTGTLHVERALRNDNSEKPTKTKWTRDVDLSAELLAALRPYVAWLTKRAMAQGWGEPVWLFVTHQNAPVDQRTMRRSFKAACKRAGLRGFRPYDLRATCASHLLGLGAEITYVAEHLGNSPAVIWKYYAKYLPSRSRRWVDHLAGARRASTHEHASGPRFGTKTWNREPKMVDLSDTNITEVVDSVNGEPWWDRTTDPLIKSQVLFQLS